MRNKSDQMRDPLKYSIPGSNSVALDAATARRIKKHSDASREHRFQLFLIAAGIRKTHKKEDGNFNDQFHTWWKKHKMEDVFGSLSSFSKSAAAGDVVHFVANHTSNPQKYLQQLPTSLRALNAIAQLMEKDETAIKLCLDHHPKRKSLSEPKHEWGRVKDSPLIHPDVTEAEITAFIEKWFEPSQPQQQPVSSKEMVLLAKIFVSKQLFAFDKKTGKHTGNVTLPEVKKAIEGLERSLSKKSFALQDEMERVKKRYGIAQKRSNPAKKIKDLPSKRILKGKRVSQRAKAK